MPGCKSCNQKNLTQQTQQYIPKYSISTQQTINPIIEQQKPIIQVSMNTTNKLNNLLSILKTDPTNQIIQNQIKILIQNDHQKKIL
jgi:hypothetical protein